jgi:hypothetical protein
MTHLELENLASEYLEGQLDAARRTQVEAHLAECIACRELMADLRHTLEICRAAEELEPAPWLISKIMLATVGERKPTWREQLAAFLRPSVQPRVAYAVAMAVFSFSIIVNAAGLNLRNLTLQDLNPRTWMYEAQRTGHLLYARAEKYYYDLRVVYEIESRFRQQRNQPREQEPGTPERQTPPPAGSTDSTQPATTTLASMHAPVKLSPEFIGTVADLVQAGRSPRQ